jgi:glycerophosphoryl diester phosphodiesterase
VRAAPRPARVATVDGLTFPLVVAHRGGANLFPENTLAAYEGAAALGCQAVEAGDLQLTADGALVAMHDATVDRTTTGSGNVADFTLAGIRALRVDASSWFGGRWADQAVPTFPEILDRLGGAVVLVPESKSVGAETTRAIVDAVTARGLQAGVIIQSFRLAEIELIARAGIAPLYLMNSGAEAAPATIAAAGARFVGLNKDAPHLANVVGRLRAAGLRVLAWTVDTQHDYDEVMAAGCDGVISNEPLYAARADGYRSARAPWHTEGTFGHGMLAYPGVGPLVADPDLPGGRGGFIGAPGAWRWTLDRTPYLAGPVCPVPVAEGSYTVTVELVYDTPPAADRTSWAGVYFGTTTDDCPDDRDPTTGYRVALRWDGELVLAAQPAGRTGMVELTRCATSPLATPVLAGPLAPVGPVTVLPVAPLPAALSAGHRFVLPTGQVAALSAAVGPGATALPVEPLVPAAPVEPGSVLAQQVTLMIATTPSGITVTRADDGGALSVVDRIWSGGYIFLRNHGDGVAAVSCSTLTIGEGGLPWRGAS